ncbi:MAG TPA: SpoIIE family protein phosphatase [Rhodothermia bacterium]|nr:SpoIIE family protein phosphatase [Rhodothermia bacterium]
MNRDAIERFKGALVRRRELLLDWMRGNGPKDRPGCDGELIRTVEETLHRIDHGEFGRCAICHGEVETSRLALDYTASVCIECLSEIDRRSLERELEMAAQVQKNLLPRNVPALPNTDIAVHSQPAGIVGGDYFDFFPAPGGAQSFAIGDVMGKGLPASMLMSSLQASLRILGPELGHLTDLAVRINALFRYNLSLVRFISMILARVDTEKKQIQYLNAGHNPALLWRSSDRSGIWLQPTGPAVGLVKDPIYTTEEIDLHVGDLLIMYTDGLVEARNGSSDEFGATRLLEFAAANEHLGAERFVAGLRDAVLSHSGSKLHDDLTLMVIRSTG